MPEPTNADKLDDILMHCPDHELPALLNRAQVIAKTRQTSPAKRKYERKGTTISVPAHDLRIAGRDGEEFTPEAM